ncbi:MAG: hypothetical protein JO319_03640, partial [Acidobacteriaceae bacterium]|nr:hypothetical protein [Acidobacteriaceae bacterium]
MFCRTIIGLLIVVSLQAGEFQSGQAARAVIGQSNFSVRETGVSATALALQGNHLYAAEGSGKILTFDIAKLPGPREDMAGYPKGSCNVCGLAALAVANQNVFPGIAGVSSLGRTVVAADPAHHHVLIWRDSSEPNAEPDVILGRPDSSSISASTLVNPVSVAFDGRHVFVGDAALHRVLVWDTLPTSNDQPADAVLGQPSFSSTDTSDNPDAGTIFLPSALASDGTNLFVADAAAHRILVFTAGDSALPEDAVVNSATLSGGPIAPGTLVTIRAAALSTRSESAKQTADERLPVKLGAVEVVMNGVALPLLSVSPQEIQAQIPYG